MKPVSDTIFAFNDPASRPVTTHERCTAESLGLRESWFQEAIFANPALVMGACEAAGLTDDEWYRWGKEFLTDVGPIDVLLVSSEGRVAIVETKLASNPENRRKVLAQALDYLTNLPTSLRDSMPPIPSDANGEPVADPDDIRRSVESGNVVIVIAGDNIDSRVARLSTTLFATNLVKPWDLYLVDLTLYRPVGVQGGYLVVPTVTNVVKSDRVRLSESLLKVKHRRPRSWLSNLKRTNQRLVDSDGMRSVSSRTSDQAGRPMR